MKNVSKSLSILSLLSLSVVAGMISGCKLKDEKKISWETDLITPLFESEVTISSIIKDSSLIMTNPDSSISLIYGDTVFDITTDSLLRQIPEDPYIQSFSLEEITIQPGDLEYSTSLGDLVPTLGPPWNSLLNNGVTIPVLPNFNFGFVTFPYDMIDYYQEAEITSGKVIVEIENNFPVGIDSLSFRVRNDSAPVLNSLVNFDLTNIARGGIVKDSFIINRPFSNPLYFHHNIRLDIFKLKTQPGNNVTIDLDDDFKIKLTFKDLQGKSVTAKLPQQKLVDTDFDLPINIGEDDFSNPIALEQMKLKEGSLSLKIASTIRDTVDAVLTTSSITRNGQPLSLSITLPPAQNGQLAILQQNIDLSNTEVDLTAPGTSGNQLSLNVEVEVFPTGNMVHIDENDSVQLEIAFLNAKPTFVKGFFGKYEIAIDEQVGFKFFEAIKGGTFDPLDPKIRMRFINSFGADNELQINEIKAYNRRSGDDVAFSGSVLQSPVFVPGPSYPNIGQSVASQVEFNKNNSNLNNFISILPDSLTFDLITKINTNANPGLLDNFATENSRITAILEFEAPLAGIANNIILQDEVEIDFAGLEYPEGITETELKFVAKNSFPFDAGLKLYFLDETGDPVDSLFTASSDLVKAGMLDGNGRVKEATTSVLKIELNKERLEKLKSLAKTAFVEFSMTTQPAGQAVKLDYNSKINFQLIADFGLVVGN